MNAFRVRASVASSYSINISPAGAGRIMKLPKSPFARAIVEDLHDKFVSH
jgi:hypothetical protein